MDSELTVRKSYKPLNLSLPAHITFTGVDDQTDIIELLRLSIKYPIEWGVLFSRSRQGDDPRYPSVKTIENLAVESKQLRLVAHICGSYTEDIVKNKSIDAPHDFPISFDHFRRIQINHPAPNIRHVVRFSEHHNSRCIIQSSDPINIPYYANLDVLFDRSGGRGIVPDEWPISPNWRGYAGGLNETNILDTIAKVGGGRYWLDLESGARVDNRFDLSMCRQICQLIWGEGRQ